MLKRLSRRDGSEAVPLPEELEPAEEPRPSIGQRILRVLSLCKMAFVVSRPLFEKKSRWTITSSILIVVALTVASSELTVLIGHASRNSMNALTGRLVDGVDFEAIGWLVRQFVACGATIAYAWLYLFLLLLAVATPPEVYCNYHKGKLAIDSRYFLSLKYLRAQFTPGVGQKIEEEGAISFVDQRITDNIKDFCNQAVALLQQQVQGMVNIVLWTWDLWYLSERLTIAVWLWAIVDSIVSIWIGKPLLNLNSGMSDREADLRSTLQEARVNAKKIAHTQTEWKFFRRALANLKHLASTQGEIVKSTAYVQAFTTYANGVVPAMPLVPLLMADAVVKHGPGAILEAGVGVPLLFSGLSVVVTQFSSIFSFLAQGERLYVLREEQKKHAEDAVPT